MSLEDIHDFYRSWTPFTSNIVKRFEVEIKKLENINIEMPDGKYQTVNQNILSIISEWVQYIQLQKEDFYYTLTDSLTFLQLLITIHKKTLKKIDLPRSI
jgi:hypothetical protein